MAVGLCTVFQRLMAGLILSGSQGDSILYGRGSFLYGGGSWRLGCLTLARFRFTIFKIDIFLWEGLKSLGRICLNLNLKKCKIEYLATFCSFSKWKWIGQGTRFRRKLH